MRWLLLLALTLATALRAQEPAAQMRFSGADGLVRSAAPAATQIDLTVTAMLVEGVVRQRFRNDTDQFVEAVWLQALPDDAAVHAFLVRIGERRIHSVVQPRVQAQQIYRNAVQAGQRAAIVEQTHANGFSTRVANVAPGEWVDVELKYSQVLRYQDGLFKLSFPLAVHSKTAQIRAGVCQSVAETGPDACSASNRAVDLSVHLMPSLPIKRIDSNTHDITVAYAGASMEVALKAGPVADDRDFELTWEPEPQSEPTAALMTEHKDGAYYALLMLVPPKQALESLNRELILVIDTSGSMYGDALSQAKAAAQDALTRLKPSDRFNVIRFSDASARLFESPLEASRERVDQALRYVDALNADGGTNMTDALGLSLRGEAPPGWLRQVVFATDGEVEQEAVLLEMIERDLGATRLFPIGIGQAPNAAFLRRASERGRGAYLTVRNLDEVAAQLQTLFNKLDRPVLKDFTLKFPNSAEIYPSRLPDLYHGEPLLISAKLADNQGVVSAAGLLAGGRWERSLKLATPVHDAGIARLWARRKVTDLEDGLHQGGPVEAMQAEITALGLAHNLVTRYTSLVAVDQAPTRRADQSLALAALNTDAIALMATASAKPLWLCAAILLGLLALGVHWSGRTRA